MEYISSENLQLIWHTLNKIELALEGCYRIFQEAAIGRKIATVGKVYKRLVLNTMQHKEDYADAILRVYNNPICEVLDNYDCSAYYEPSPYITRSYYAGGF